MDAARDQTRTPPFPKAARIYNMRRVPPHLKQQLNMGVLDFLKTQTLEVIEWVDDSRDTLSYRFPDDDKAIKRGAQLIVRESQNVQFVYLGQFGDTFGPGKHTLSTDNIPILTKLKSWKFGFESPFKADVYYVITRLFTGNKWGTSNPIMLRDEDLGVVRARAFGTYDFKIVDPALFLKEVAGTDHHFRLDEFHETMRSRIVSVFSESLAEARVPIFDVATRHSELGASLLPLINAVTTAKYGLQITSFVVENVSVPEEVEQAIDKRSSMSAVGNLNDYVRFQLGNSLTQPGGGGGGGGVAGDLAVGLAMAQQLVQGGILNPGSPPASAQAPAASAAFDLLSPADAAKLLGVSEADVTSTIESGELRAKKIGTTYRISRAALEEFLQP
jgi:excisionase family DNA binding protein